MAKYVKVDDLLEYLDHLRKNRQINDSPYKDRYLLTLRHMVALDSWNPILFDFAEIGGCEKCRWRERHQKCACCRRNRHMKDCFEEE